MFAVSSSGLALEIGRLRGLGPGGSAPTAMGHCYSVGPRALRRDHRGKGEGQGGEPNWVGTYTGKKKRKDRKQKPNILNQAPTRAY